MIIMQNITKVYGQGEKKVVALDDVSIYVEKGSFCAVVGSSGSGKSTLMNIAGCLDRPTQGTYFLDNNQVDAMGTGMLSKMRSHKIGFIFQSFNLVKNLTALENVVLPLMFAGVPYRERVARGLAVLQRVGIAERSGHRPSQLSGGQQQRVAIARAIIQRPELILADEPTGNLDNPSGQAVMELLEELNAEGSTLVMITHDNKLAERANKILRIEKGQIYKTEVDYGKAR